MKHKSPLFLQKNKPSPFGQSSRLAVSNCFRRIFATVQLDRQHQTSDPGSYLKFGFKPILFWLLLIFNLLSIRPIQAQPSGFVDETFLDGWNQVTGFTWDDNGRMYVWEKAGKVWIVENGTRLPSPLIDISQEVGDWRDFGLLGFALDPNFLSNGYIYLLYVVDRHHLMNFGTANYSSNINEYYKATIGRVTRYQALSSSGFTTVSAASRTILIGESPSTGMPILHESHGVGHLAFGTDGTLMVSMGDGASYSSIDGGSASETYWQQALSDGIITTQENIGAYRSQILDSHNGKVLRINPSNGNGVSNNPYYDASNPRSARSRVWARGLRNPYRFTKIPGTGSASGNPGQFVLGDVGWNDREEMSIITAAGQNFGWPKYEGMTKEPGYNNSTYAPASHVLPKVDWRSSAPRVYVNGQIQTVGNQFPGSTFSGNASTGGYWYTGTDFPPEYRNTYFHADYGGGWVRNFSFDGSYNPTAIKNFLSNVGAVVFIGGHATTDGLYYVRYPNQIRRVTYINSPNNPPVAIAAADKTSGPSPLSVQFTGSNSFDPDSDPLTYLWDFGDGSTSTQVNPTHIFDNADGSSFTVTLRVTDPNNLSDETTLGISLDNTAPIITATSIDGIDYYSNTQNTTLNLSAEVRDIESPVSALSFSWQLALFHNDHHHPETPDPSPVTSAVLTPLGCDGATYWYRVSLTVTDPGGLSAYFEKDIYPDCPGASQTITFGSLPDRFTLDAPFTINATASSGLPVSFYLTDGPATVSDNVVTLLGTPGTVTIVATQHGNGAYAPAKAVFQSFKVASGGNPLSLSLNDSDISCFGANDGSISASVSGGAGGYTYAWNNGAVSSSLSGLAPGTYSLTVTDNSNGFRTASATITQPPALTVSVSGTNPDCSSSTLGSAVANVSGGTGSLGYSWSGPDGFSASTASINGLSAGTYSVTVTDLNGCTDQASVVLSGSVPIAENFPNSQLTHSGTGFSVASLNFPDMRDNLRFTISGLGQRTNGNPKNYYIELVSITYSDGGATQSYGTFSGADVSSVEVLLPQGVSSVQVSLSDGWDGNAGSTLSVQISEVTSCSTGETCPDDDHDGVCNEADLCPGSDDKMDSDGDGIPDGCDTPDECGTVVDNFSDNPLQYSGNSSTSTTLSFSEAREEVSFTISGMDARTKGKADRQYEEEVTVSYVDAGAGNHILGSFNGVNTSNVFIQIPGSVISVTVSLKDGDSDGFTASQMSIDLSPVSSCIPGALAADLNLVLPQGDTSNKHQAGLKIFPNPAGNFLTAQFGLLEAGNVRVEIIDIYGRILQVQDQTLDAGLHETAFSLNQYADGVYFLRLKRSGKAFTEKFFIAR